MEIKPDMAAAEGDQEAVDAIGEGPESVKFVGGEAVTGAEVGPAAAMAEADPVAAVAKAVRVEEAEAGPVEASNEGVGVEEAEVGPDAVGAVTAVPEDVMAEAGASTEDGGGDMVSDGKGAADADDVEDEWCIVGKSGRVSTGGGGGVEEQAETSFPIDDVLTC